MVFFTIGVYNRTEKEFFDLLVNNHIDSFCDIRQRRGVRGSKYSFVNSNRLQQELSRLDIKYGHIAGLAPTHEIRDLQKEDDLSKGILKSERQVLGETFVSEYTNRVLDKFNFEYFFDILEQSGARKVVLFCVEQFPQACHRSIVSGRLNDIYGYTITHL